MSAEAGPLLVPRPHQEEARDAILAVRAAGRPGFLLGDLTGLGKTLSAWLAVAAMPEAEVLVMTHYLGFSPQEIATLLGENLSTVGVRLHRARQRFRVLYHKETTNELS